MTSPLGIFGTVREIDPDASVSLQAEGLNITRQGSVLEIEYEGHYIDVDDLLESLADQVQDKAYGQVDCIDHQSWKVYRYELLQGKWRVKTVDPDAVLEGYKY